MALTSPLSPSRLWRGLRFVFPGALLFVASPLAHAEGGLGREMTFSIFRSSDPFCEPKCPEWIAAEGEINERTPEKFDDMLERLGKRKLPLLINSPGGLIEYAMEIGEIIRKRKMTVEVARTFPAFCDQSEEKCKRKLRFPVLIGYTNAQDAYCSSACVYILASGSKRFVSATSRVGVHHAAYKIEKYEYFYEFSESGVFHLNRVGGEYLSQELDPGLENKSKNYFRRMGV
ncbi:hypothetical protein [Hoeflea sp.]|uniref:COG3904 family protein n=1 Tax=Hoeflea sp. TaxID=1940281 RepID=UPI0037490083